MRRKPLKRVSLNRLISRSNLPYKDAAGAVIHAWGRDHWYTNIFELGSEVTPAVESAAPSPGDGPPPPAPPNGSSYYFTRGGTRTTPTAV